MNERWKNKKAYGIGERIQEPSLSLEKIEDFATIVQGLGAL